MSRCITRHSCCTMRAMNNRFKSELRWLARQMCNVTSLMQPFSACCTIAAQANTTPIRQSLRTLEMHCRRRAGEDLPPPPKTAIAGPEYFGLIHPGIVAQIEQLDPDQSCAIYWEGKLDRLAYGQVRPIYAAHIKCADARLFLFSQEPIRQAEAKPNVLCMARDRARALR